MVSTSSDSATASIGRLLLIPMPLGDTSPALCLPEATLEAVAGLRCFVVENARTARRFLGRLRLAAPLRELAMDELDEHTPDHALPGLLAPALRGENLGLLSEAGCPVVADPGARLVALAHRHAVRVVPLVGPSAPLLALMASGLGGQQFRFRGYLPQAVPARREAIVRIEAEARRSSETQIFIETPYRNVALLDSLLEACQPDTRLAVAADLTLATELVVSRPVGEWRLAPPPDLARRPAVFLMAGPDRTRG